MKLFKLYLPLLLFIGYGAVAQENIGVAAAVNQNTTDLTLEQERKLVEAGYKIIQNHTIETDNVGRAQMLLVDGTAFTIGPNSSVTLDRFIYNPTTADGSLEVTSRGLLRLVGGKVTKKTPAIIRTNAATVGIRGGIVIVQTQGQSTKAAFVYGNQMTVTPTQNADGETTLTEDGFVVTVRNPTDDIEYPDLLTAESLSVLQEDLQAEEKDEEESEDEDSSDEDSSDDDSSDDDSIDDDSSGDDDSTSSSDDDGTSDDSSSDDTSTEETTAEADTDSDNDTDAQPDVDESALDSSGVSDNSSDVDPDDLSTADDLEASVDLDIDGSDDTEEEVAEETSEAAETSVEDTASNTQGETAVETATFEVSFNQTNLEVEENTSDVTIGVLEIDNPYDSPFTVTIEGEDSNQFSFNEETNTLMFTGSSDYETQSTYSLNLKITRATGDILIPLTFSVTDINEPSVITTSLSQESFSEDLQAGSIIAESSVIDPENDTISYTLTGTGSEDFSVSSDGQITLISSLDYETTTSYNLTLTASDGTNETTSEIAFTVTDVYEPIELSTTLAAGSFSEGIATGTTIATATSVDPEGDVITYSLSGTGSENFSISSDGIVTLASELDYETSSSYNITLTASDGTNSVDNELIITVSNVNETITLSSSLASDSFAENTASGTTIATSTATDPEGETITYSLSGTSSENFSISSDGTITLVSDLDYETLTSYNLVLSASDGTNTETTNLVFSVSNVEEAVTLSTTLASSSFSEDTSPGSLIVDTTAADPDGNEITYTLTGTGSDNFSISNDGSITLLNSLDYESQTSYTLTLTASDGTSSASSDFTFSVTDIEELIDFSTSLAASSFAEDTATGTTIATASATNTEGDAITFSLSGTGSEKFSVSSDGTVTLSSALDYESTTSYNLTLTASDGTNTATNNLLFSVSNINETVTLSTLVASSSFSEDISTGTTIATASATDPENATISYSLSGIGSDKFSVSSDGTVTLTSGLDYESTTSYSLTLTASDGTNSTSESIAFSVGDVNESLTLSTTLAANSFAEDISTGTTIATASATDPENATISYSLSGTGSDKFSVSSDGTVTLTSGLDYESTTSYSLTLTASDGTYNATDNFTVTVNNVNEAPTLSSSLAANSYAENIATGTTIATSSTSDPEGDSISYSLSGTGSDKFSVSSDGTVTLTSGLDYESTTSYSLTLTASDGTNSATSSISFSVTDISELALSASLAASSFAESVATGTTIASSSTSGSSGTVSYSLSGSDSDKFSVSSSGVVTLASAFDFESETSHSFTLTATDGSETVSQAMTVNVTDANDFQSMVMRFSGKSTGSCLGSNYSFALNCKGESDGLPSITEEQVVTTAASNAHGKYMSSYAGDETGNTYVPVSIVSGDGSQAGDTSQVDNFDFRYYFPVGGSSYAGGGQYIYTIGGPQGGNRDGNLDFSYQTVDAENTVTTTLEGHNGNNQVVHAGRYGKKLFWMVTDYASFDMNYNALQVDGDGNQSYTSKTYTSYTDQVTIATQVYTDEWFDDFTNGNKRVVVFAVMPIDEKKPNFNRYIAFPNWYPNDGRSWSYDETKDLLYGPLSNLKIAYCLAVNSAADCDADAEAQLNSYDWMEQVLDPNSDITTDRFNSSSTSISEVIEGSSLWYQVMNPSGKGVGLQANLHILDSYDDATCSWSGCNGSNDRRDQESFLSVAIGVIDKRSNDTSRYSAGDLGHGLSGYTYWSYQDDMCFWRSANEACGYDRGEPLLTGAYQLDCVTSSQSGCFLARYDSSNRPVGMMITNHDPYKTPANAEYPIQLQATKDMSKSANSVNVGGLGFGDSENTYQMLISQNYVTVGADGTSSTQQYKSLSDFRHTNFYASTATSYSGFFSGILTHRPHWQTDPFVAGTCCSMNDVYLSSLRSSSTLSTFTFDTTNDDVQVVAPLIFHSFPQNNYTSVWEDESEELLSSFNNDTLTLKFGDADNDEAKSAYISSEVFGAAILNDNAQLNGNSASDNSLAGVLVSYNTLDNEDSELFETSNSMPNTDYSTWGFWAFTSIDFSDEDDDMSAALHLGTWVAGELVSQSEIPTSGSASMSGAAAFSVAYRYDKNNYDHIHHRYTTTADVAATFNWGSSGYSGSLNFTNFDVKNPIVANAGFTSFTVAVTGTDNTYSGNSTDSLDNSWLGGASVAGALYGGSKVQESGGRFNVNLYKSGDIGTQGANDYYVAEGIYLVDCTSGTCE